MPQCNLLTRRVGDINALGREHHAANHRRNDDLNWDEDIGRRYRPHDDFNLATSDIIQLAAALMTGHRNELYTAPIRPEWLSAAPSLFDPGPPAGRQISAARVAYHRRCQAFVSRGSRCGRVSWPMIADNGSRTPTRCSRPKGTRFFERDTGGRLATSSTPFLPKLISVRLRLRLLR